MWCSRLTWWVLFSTYCRLLLRQTYLVSDTGLYINIEKRKSRRWFLSHCELLNIPTSLTIRSACLLMVIFKEKLYQMQRSTKNAEGNKIYYELDISLWSIIYWWMNDSFLAEIKNAKIEKSNVDTLMLN